jgi:serine/threonine protein kinase
MSILPGSRLGAYEVVARLGAGGMGEVFRARDAKLGRDVAIKILPEALAGEPDRLMRFEREARTLAALNHPHIAQVFGVEESPGTRARAVVARSVLSTSPLRLGEPVSLFAPPLTPRGSFFHAASNWQRFLFAVNLAEPSTLQYHVALDWWAGPR